MEFVNFPRTDDMMAHMGTGELDVGALLVSPAALNARDRGMDFRALAGKPPRAVITSSVGLCCTRT